MAIKVYGGNHGIATANVLPSSSAEALDIESTDGKDYIVIDTLNETMKIGSGSGTSDVCKVSVGANPGTVGEVFRVRQSYTADSLALIENTGAGDALHLASGTDSSSVKVLKINNGSGEIWSIAADGKVGINTSAPTAMLDVKGGTLLALSNTVASADHSGTPRVINCTAHGLEVGDTVGLLSGNSNTKEIFTVAVYNSANQFTVDSDPTNEVGTSGSNNTGYKDGPLLITQSGDGRTIFRASSDNTIIHADGTMSDTTATQSVLLCTEMGDSNPGDKVVFIGARAGKGSTANSIVAIGSECCESGAGTETVAIGYFTGNSGPSSYNTLIGARSGSLVTSTGNNNTFVGSRSGSGISDGSTSVTTGDHNVCIGAQSGALSAANNQISIGYQAIGQGENTAVIGNSNITSLATGGNGVCSLGTSSKTFKEAFLTQALINHTVVDDCWSISDDLIVGSGTDANAGIYIKAYNSSYNSNITFADGVGSSAQTSGGALQYIHTGDYFRFFAKYNGTTYAGNNNGDYQFRLNEFGTQKIQNSLANDDTARDSATNASRPVYLATTSSTNDTLIIDYAFGTVGEITLTNNITAIKFYNAPRHGSSQTMTVKIKQHSSAVTLSYSSVTIYWDTSNAKAGNLLWAGGAAHVLSTGNNDIDIVQFTCMPHGDTNRDIYGAVIGQAFA